MENEMDLDILIDQNERLKKTIKELEEQMFIFENFDKLTGLYNKNAFYEKVEEKIKGLPQSKFNIVCIDEERFKLINDLYGTEQGDAFLCYIAEALRNTICRENEFAARIGADVFAVYTERTLDEEESMVDDIYKVFHAYPLNMELTPAIGIYRAFEQGIQASRMCDRAVLALNTVKGNYIQKYAVYENQLRASLIEEQEILNDTNYAFQNREFQVYIQPQCNMWTGKIIGGEALVRWKHPKKGLIPPNSFIPVFERNGIIKDLDLYVWEETAKKIREWMDKGNRPVPISVNISRIDFFEMDVYQVLEDLVKKYRLEKRFLELEITESAYVDSPEKIIKTVDKLMKNGFIVLMDDFGSGYSALNMLKDISVHVLKLDMRFLDKEDSKSKSLLESMVNMAKWQDLKIIAEGVENRSQVNFLLDAGYNFAQGYYFYKPMPYEKFEEIISNPEKVEHSLGLFATVDDKLLRFKDLFYENMISEQLLNNLIGGVALYQYDGTKLQILKSNEEYYCITKQTDWSEDENEDILQRLLEQDREEFLKALSTAKAAGKEKCVEFRVKKEVKDGNLIWLNIKLFYLQKRGNYDLYYAVLGEVTKEMEHMEELRLSEERFRIAMDCSGDTLFELDIPTRVARYSDQSREKFGLEECVTDAPEGFIRQNTVCKEYEEVFRNIYRDIYAGKESASAVIKAKLNGGEIVWNRITLTAIKDKNGKSIKAVGLVKNVTEEIELGLKMGKEKE